MALSNHERIGKALGAWKTGLPPFVERVVEVAHRKNWWATVKQTSGAVVTVTVETQASVPSGVPDGTVRTVEENCRKLKFSSHGFQRE